jgi:hypothetical protein
MSLDDIGNDLYGLPLDQFIGARNARAKELAASGDRDAAAVVRKLSKPSVTAWLANALVRKHPGKIDELLALGRDLRQAQNRGAGDDMRRLSTRRQELVRRLVVLASAEAGLQGSTSVHSSRDSSKEPSKQPWPNSRRRRNYERGGSLRL